MKTVKTNIWNLEVGDKISFTNKYGTFIELTVSRVSEKSWYSVNRSMRSSWGTLADYEKSFPDFKITK